MQPHQPASSDLWEGDRPSPSDQELQQLRELLLGGEIEKLAELQARLDALGLSADDLADKLPEAISLRTSRDNTLGQALAPTISDAFDEAVRQNPEKITDAIFPIIGPAIRKSIAETIAGLVQTINQAFEHSLSPQGMKWRIESWRTGVPYGEVVIKHSLVYRVEHVFLIHNETGLLLNQVTAEGLEAPDADVISGMLTAIKDFVQDSFAADPEGRLRRMTVADTTVHVQHGPEAMVAAAVRGHPPERFDERLTAIVERVHLTYRPALTEFDGDAEPLAPTAPMLEEALETVKNEDAGPGKLAPRLAWAVLAVLLVLAGVFYVRGSRQWAAALEELEATPGVVVVEANRGWRTWRLSGLADPDAVHPDTLLAARRTPNRFEATWEPYLSFDPRVVAARSRRTLGLPPDLDVAVRGDTLILTGPTTPARIREARRRLGDLPGTTVMTTSGVTWAAPDSLTRLAADIGRRRIDFALGSTVLSAAARLQLDSLAADLNAHLPTAVAHGFALQLTMTGHADSTGSVDVNRRLSEQRAAAALVYLASRGVPAARLAPRGGGAPGTPLPNGTSRSVTFELSVHPRPDEGPASR